MSIGSKIRFLLLILGACCIITAISLRHSVTKKELLNHEASSLQSSLSEKERSVYEFLSNKKELANAKQLHKNEALGLAFISKYRSQGIDILTYEGDELLFWSSVKVIPLNPQSYQDGSSYQQFPNGWYEVIKKTIEDETIIFLILVETQYNVKNPFLESRIATSLLKNNSLVRANFTDHQIYPIVNLSGKILFEVKLNQKYSKSIYANIEIWLWVIGLFSFCLFFNSFCSWLAKRGNLISATVLIILFFLTLRATDLSFGWFNREFDLAIFDPRVYAESDYLPSLGHFLLNVIALTWVVLFIFTYVDKYTVPQWLAKSKAAGLVFQFALLIIFGLLAFIFDRIFSGLIDNSKIDLNITNIIDLGWTSWIGIIILCLVWFNIYIIANVFMQVSLQLQVTNRERLLLFFSVFLLYFLFRLQIGFSIFFVLYAFFIYIIGWNFYVKGSKFSVSVFAALFFCLATISSLKFQQFVNDKERSNRITISQKLVAPDDISVISTIENLENGILSNNFVLDYFKKPALNSVLELRKNIDKQYLDKFLPRFEYNIFVYNTLDSSSALQETLPLSYFKKLVQAGSVKISESNFFYRLNDTFGYQNYFGIIPIYEGARNLGTMVIELKSQAYNYKGQLPDILVDNSIKNDKDYNDYSIAFYKDGKLESQSGKYTYKISSAEYSSKLLRPFFYNDTSNYSHLVYSPVKSKVVVISKENVSSIMLLASLSFFFLVFIIFSVIIYTMIWLLKNIDESWGGWFNINRSLMINANKILYKTRIQFSIVLSVVATLLIVGWATYFYISQEYRVQQDNFIKDKIRKVQQSYERQISISGIPPISDNSINDFNQFADINAAYLNLFDTKGMLLYTSLPKMYDLGIIDRRMGPLAFINLSKLQKSEFINPNEKIGTFTYSAAYAPIRNAQNQTVGFIGVPYYANEADYQSKIQIFINTLINIYALVFVGIGILAVFLANQITGPLTFIQDSIRKTKLGQTNQPIQWSRHDEIGSLIREYNKMIAALEDSAIKLARSERESAWREMAKQVAHEIKNPLTPLKLGVQLLEKSWKEKDPNFESKFERFNKSFIEQIDSLSTIASEFSNFAKMPDTKLEKLSLVPIITKARNVFSSTENVEIFILNHSKVEIYIQGDKDQLLRIFNNLLKNAIEASSDNQKSFIKISINNDHKQVYIDVEDNGKGIDEILQTKIFVPNFTTKSSGTGLGLAFVKQAVENAGGSVSFRSVIDVGTTFYLTFPLS